MEKWEKQEEEHFLEIEALCSVLEGLGKVHHYEHSELQAPGGRGEALEGKGGKVGEIIRTCVLG